MGLLKSRLKRFLAPTSAEQNTPRVMGNETTGELLFKNNEDDSPARSDMAHSAAQSFPEDMSSSFSGPTKIPEAETIQVPNRNQTDMPVSLWDSAYDALREERGELIAAYEVILSQAFVKGQEDISSSMEGKNLENQIPQHDAIARREMLKKVTELGLKHMEDKEVKVTLLGHDIVLKDTMASVAGAVEWTENYVKAAVKDSPYASTVMAGISLILPLLKNPVAAEAANRAGFTYVTSQMRCYIEMESLRLLPDMAAELKSSLADGVADLYKLIIEFQVGSAIRFYRSRTKNYFRDTVNYDGWEEKLSRIKESEASLDKMFERVLSGKSLQQLKDLTREAEDSRKALDDMLGKFDTLINLSREQTKIMEKNEQRLSQEDNRRCQRALQATDPVLDKERILLKKDQLLRDSYCWVLDTNEFQEWRNGTASRLLWLTGHPGKGKTMLICGIIDELNLGETADRSNICYFFFQATDDRTNNAVAFLRGLTYMLVKEQPSLMKYLHENLNDDGDRHFEGPNAWVALSKVFIDMLEDSELQDTYLVVDALDECSTDLDLLLGFIVKISSAYSKVKWITSSRNWPNIEKGLKLAQKDRLCIELNEESVAGAVDSYIRTKVDWLAQRNDYDEETQEVVQQYLLVNASGTFLWVALVCKELADISGWEVEDLLAVFPPGLDDLYERMLGQILSSRHVSTCKDILAVLLFVHRPITLAELASLVEMPPRISRNVKALEEVIGLCGSFLALQKHTVSFVHQSAKDFFLERASTEIFPNGPEDLHHKIFRKSLHTMACTLRRDIYSLGAPGSSIDDLGQPDPDPLAPARYACIFWADHLKACGPKKRAIDDFCEGGIVDKFLQRDLLHWLESLCLLGALPEGVGSILILESLVQEVTGSSLLSDRARDASRFTRYHKGLIEKYPLQLYVSALTFSPVKSMTRTSYAHEEPDWFLKSPRVQESWSHCVQTLEGGTDTWNIQSVCWSPDGRRVASASDDSFRIWDPATGQCISTLVVPVKDVPSGWIGKRSVTWPNDTPLGLGERDGLTILWNLTTSECISTLKGHDYESLCAVSIFWSQRQSRIATGSMDGPIQIWNTETGQCISILNDHSNCVCGLAWAPNETLLASGSKDGTVKIWEVGTWQCISTFKELGSESGVRSIVWSPDSTMLASGSDQGEILVWDTKTGQKIAALCESAGDWVSSLHWSQDGSQLASSSWGRINIWDMGKYECISTLYGHSNEVTSVAWSQDGTMLASGSWDGTTKIWEPGAEQQKVPGIDGQSGRITALVMSPDELKLAYSSVGTDTIQVWDLSTENVVSTMGGHTGEIYFLAWSPNGTQIASASRDRYLKIWTITTAECISSFKDYHDFMAMAWSPDNSRLATTSYDAMINVWDSRTLQCIFTLAYDPLEVWDSSVMALVWSLDGGRIALRSTVGRVNVWDTTTRDCVTFFDERDFFPDSSFLWDTWKIEIELRALLDRICDHNSDNFGSLSISARSYDFDNMRKWVTYCGKPILRLPTDYRPGKSVVGKNFIGIGSLSGHFLILQFSDVNPLN